MLSTVTATAQDTSATPPTCLEITIAGEKLFCIRDGIGAFTASERAQAIQARLRTFAHSKSTDSSKLTTVSHDNVIDLKYEEQILASLTEADAQANGGENLRAFVDATLKKITLATTHEKESHSSQAILTGVWYTVVASIVLILILTLFSIGFPRIYTRIREAQGRFIRSVRIQSFEILTADRITETLLWMAQASRLLLTLIIFYIYIPLVLSWFPWTEDYAPRIFNYILDPLQQIVTVVIDYIPKFFFLVVIIAATRVLLRLVRFFFLELERGNIRFHGFYKEWAQPTYKLVRFFIFAFALVMAFPYLPGSSSPAFQGVSVFLGVLLSFGSSSAIGNIVAGIVLTYMRPYKIGDRVQISNTVGDITEKTLLITRIRTIKNVDVTVPNTMVLGSHIINYSATAATQGLILNTTVTLGYNIPWQRAHELLVEAARRTEKILATPKPFILQTALNDFAVAYELNAYTAHPNDMAKIYSDLHLHVQDTFNEAGVEIMSPHYLALRKGEESTAHSP